MDEPAEDWAFLVLVSDGITDSMSDQEIVDLTRGQTDPTKAAQKIVTFAEDVGGCVVFLPSALPELILSLQGRQHDSARDSAGRLVEERRSGYEQLAERIQTSSRSWTEFETKKDVIYLFKSSSALQQCTAR